jgi:hypothetical protein
LGERARYPQAIGPLIEVAAVDGVGPEYLDLPEADIAKSQTKFFRLEEAHKWLTHCGHAACKQIEGDFRGNAQAFARDSKIKGDGVGWRQRVKQPQSIECGFARQVRGHAKPREKCRCVELKSSARKSIVKRLPLEVYRSKGQ